MNRSAGRYRLLAWLFGMLASITTLVGGLALSRQSDLVIVLALTPLFVVLAIAFGVSARRH